MSFLPTNDQFAIALQPNEGKILNVLGETITIKLAGKDTDGAYTVLQAASPSQSGPPLHVHHQEDEALYVLEGEYEIQLGDHTIKAVPGSFVFAPREIPHAFRNVSSGLGRVLVIATPAGIEHFFEEISDLAAAEPGPPNIEKITAIAAQYGIEFIVHEASPD